MSIVHCAFTVDDFIDGRPLPPVDLVRPPACPSCEAPSRRPGKSPTLIGHGSYPRRVRGAADQRDTVRIRVRRFLCIDCGATTTVLPSTVYPRRHYSASAILASLVRVLLEGHSTTAARQQVSEIETGRPWRSLSRWTGELFRSLWPWDAGQVGFRAGSATDIHHLGGCFSRLIAIHGVGPSPTIDELACASEAMFRGLHAKRTGQGEARRRLPLQARRAHPHGLSQQPAVRLQRPQRSHRRDLALCVEPCLDGTAVQRPSTPPKPRVPGLSSKSLQSRYGGLFPSGP